MYLDLEILMPKFLQNEGPLFLLSLTILILSFFLKESKICKELSVEQSSIIYKNQFL